MFQADVLLTVKGQALGWSQALRCVCSIRAVLANASAGVYFFTFLPPGRCVKPGIFSSLDIRGCITLFAFGSAAHPEECSERLGYPVPVRNNS
jgi:hypothetical protein